MAEHAARSARWELAGRLVPRIAIGVAAIGVFLTWTSDGPIGLSGIHGPNNGWLVLIFAGLALAWARSASRGSWAGVAGLLGAAFVIGWTAVESWVDGRDVLGATAGFGLLLVVAASVVLAATAVAGGVRAPRGLRRSVGSRSTTAR